MALSRAKHAVRAGGEAVDCNAALDEQAMSAVYKGRVADADRHFVAAVGHSYLPGALGQGGVVTARLHNNKGL